VDRVVSPIEEGGDLVDADTQAFES
jgi:hypothetical protein